MELLKVEIMNSFLYIIAVALVVLWVIGFVGFHIGGLIHILLAFAIIAILLRIIKGEKLIK